MINQLFKPLLETLPENNRLERIWVLAKTDFLKRYYGSFLGLVWALINPLAKLAIYYFVFTIVFKNRLPNFALFLFLGLLLYLFFMEVTTKGLQLFKSKRYILENIQINWLDIYYAGIISAFFGFLFNFATYFLISLYLGAELSAHALLVPILILNLIVFSLAVKILLSLIQIYVKDIIHVWDLVRMMLLWLSGIFFHIDPNATWKSAMLYYLTPLPGIIQNARNVLIYGKPVDGYFMVYDMAYAVALLGIALFCFNRLRYKALEKI